MASVLLGVPDAAVKIATTWDVNKIGGAPDVMVKLSTSICAQCHKMMGHVMQIYCPLELSPFHRVLHIFACLSKACWNKSLGWKVYRSQLKDNSSVAKHDSGSNEKVAMETSDWCDEADDWGCDEDSQVLVAMVADTVTGTKDDIPCSRQIDAVSVISDKDTDEFVEEECIESSVLNQLEELDVAEESTEVVVEDDCLHSDRAVLENALDYLATNNSQSDVVSESAVSSSTSEAGCPDILKAFYLNVFDEPIDEMSDAKHVKKLLKDYEQREHVDVSSLVDSDRDLPGGKSGSGEKYEKTELKHGDKYFHKFTKHLRVCPEQVVRYQYNGIPVPVSRPQVDLTPSPCSTCGASRVFELQLLPALIPYLQYSHSADPVVEFGTVMVFTCSRSCWEEDSPQPREEFVIVQSDPDQHLFKI